MEKADEVTKVTKEQTRNAWSRVRTILASVASHITYWRSNPPKEIMGIAMTVQQADVMNTFYRKRADQVLQAFKEFVFREGYDYLFVKELAEVIRLDARRKKQYKKKRKASELDGGGGVDNKENVPPPPPPPPPPPIAVMKFPSVEHKGKVVEVSLSKMPPPPTPPPPPPSPRLPCAFDCGMHFRTHQECVDHIQGNQCPNDTSRLRIKAATPRRASSSSLLDWSDSDLI